MGFTLAIRQLSWEAVARPSTALMKRYFHNRSIEAQSSTPSIIRLRSLSLSLSSLTTVSASQTCHHFLTNHLFFRVFDVTCSTSLAIVSA
jgi:hypothetical protein